MTANQIDKAISISGTERAEDIASKILSYTDDIKVYREAVKLITEPFHPGGWQIQLLRKSCRKNTIEAVRSLLEI